MRKFVMSLSSWTEFWIVLAVSQGWFVAISLRDFLWPRRLVETDAGLLHLVVLETVLVLLVGAFLRQRGWSLQHLGLVPGLKQTAIGICMAGAIVLIHRAAYFLTVWLLPQMPSAAVSYHVVHAGITALGVFALVLMNPLYEELFAGYVMKTLNQYNGPILAVGASVFIRVLYHLYQGPLSVLHVVPLGLIFGAWYVRTGRLWPLVVGHMALDLFSLAHYVRW